MNMAYDVKKYKSEITIGQQLDISWLADFMTIIVCTSENTFAWCLIMRPSWAGVFFKEQCYIQQSNEVELSGMFRNSTTTIERKQNMDRIYSTFITKILNYFIYFFCI